MMIILSLLAGCFGNFFKPPNEECTAEAVEKRHLVYFRMDQTAEAEACEQKLEKETGKPFIIEPHMKGTAGNDPFGLDVYEYQDGFKVVPYKAVIEGWGCSKVSP